MTSCLYRCRVMHHRLWPKRHRFAYRLFLLALDLDELPAVAAQARILGINRPGLFSFQESDYLPTGGEGPLKARVIRWLAERGIELSGGRVVLVTLPRMLGYVFNPVSFYFCFGADGRPAAAIAEVTNTFREIKPFLIGPVSGAGPGRFQSRQPKHFYVSPYSDVDVQFDFSLAVPDERLAIAIDDVIGQDRTLVTTLDGRRGPLTSAALLGAFFRYPLLTVRVIGGIHWHALRLWLKRVPWHRKAARAADQRGLYRPHPAPAAHPWKRRPAASLGVE